MSKKLYKIVYCSRNLISSADGDRELSHILGKARANNSRHEITGALLFNAGFFAQVLEGPQAAIERIFERIQCDPRHNEVTVLESGSAGERIFPEWAMAHVRPPSALQSDDIASTLDQALLNPAAAGREVLDLLRNLVAQED